VAAQLHDAIRIGSAELVRDADGVADEMAPDRATLACHGHMLAPRSDTSAVASIVAKMR
jgi:hypothetical protein